MENRLFTICLHFICRKLFEVPAAPDEFTGYISTDVKISGVLKMLEESGGTKFTVKGRKLKVKSIQ